MARHKVDICGVNTANLKALSNEENIQLFKRLKNGDVKAKDELVNGNLKLVLSILKKYNNRTDNMDDLFQVGVIGLIKAIENFDLSYELCLSTYACPMIIGEIKRFLRDNNSLRVSRSVKDLAYKAMKAKEELINENGYEPSIAVIAKKLNESELNITNALSAMKETVSMFEPIYNDGNDTLYLVDQLEDKKNTYDLETHMDLKNAFKNLKDKEKQILNGIFIIGKTQVELASEIGISQAQISRLEKSGLENLKRAIK